MVHFVYDPIVMLEIAEYIIDLSEFSYHNQSYEGIKMQGLVMM